MNVFEQVEKIRDLLDAFGNNPDYQLALLEIVSGQIKDEKRKFSETLKAITKAMKGDQNDDN